MTSSKGNISTAKKKKHALLFALPCSSDIGKMPLIHLGINSTRVCNHTSERSLHTLKKFHNLVETTVYTIVNNSSVTRDILNRRTMAYETFFQIPKFRFKPREYRHYLLWWFTTIKTDMLHHRVIMTFFLYLLEFPIDLQVLQWT